MLFSNSFYSFMLPEKKKNSIFFSVSVSSLIGSYIYIAVHVAFMGVGDWYSGTEVAAFGLPLMSLKLQCVVMRVWKHVQLR